MKALPEQLWTIDDVAEFCQIKPSVVRYWVRNGDIPHIRLGKQIRFKHRDIEEWIAGKVHRMPNWDLSSLRDV